MITKNIIFINLLDLLFEGTFKLIWMSYGHLISIFIIFLFVLIVGLFLPEQASVVRFVNFILFALIFLNLFISSWDILVLDLSQWTSLNPYNNLFKIVASLTVCAILFGICDKYYLVQNSNIEFPILVVLTHIAALILMNSLELTSIILALESIGLCSYVLVGFERNNKFSTSSAVKYLILGTIPGGLLILGVSLLYKNFGTFSKDNLELILSTFIDFSNVNLKNYQTNDFFFYLISLQNSGIQGLDSFVPEILSNNYADNSDIEKFYFDNIYVYNLNDLVLYNTNVEIKETSYVLNNNFDYYLNLSSFLYYKYIFLSTNIAVLFIIINFLFKVTAAPFHAWAPSVYGGAPLPTAAFLSIFSKVALLFLMTTFLLTNFNSLLQVWQPILLFCSVLTLFVATLGAISERILKRFFVYSSMGHVGFMILGIACSNIDSIKASLNYLLIYIVSALIVWLAVMYLTRKTTYLTNLKSLCVNNVALSFILSITMFSMSGIPPLGGFFVKFEILHCILNSSLYYLGYIVFLLTVVNFFYYLRIIKIIYFESTKIFYKQKYINNEKLLVLSILVHIILFFVIYVQQPILYSIDQVMKSLL